MSVPSRIMTAPDDDAQPRVTELTAGERAFDVITGVQQRPVVVVSSFDHPPLRTSDGVQSSGCQVGRSGEPQRREPARLRF